MWKGKEDSLWIQIQHSLMFFNFRIEMNDACYYITVNVTTILLLHMCAIFRCQNKIKMCLTKIWVIHLLHKRNFLLRSISLIRHHTWIWSKVRHAILKLIARFRDMRDDWWRNYGMWLLNWCTHYFQKCTISSSLHLAFLIYNI